MVFTGYFIKLFLFMYYLEIMAICCKFNFFKLHSFGVNSFSAEIMVVENVGHGRPQHSVKIAISWPFGPYDYTAVQLVFNPFSQFVPKLKLYSQLQLSLWSDPIPISVPKPTWWVLVKIQGDRNVAKSKWRNDESLSIFWLLETKEQWHW